jgi:protein-S-isoprenylcysteine O-methyltransferase Ste14
VENGRLDFEMLTIVLQALSWLAFLAGTITLGAWLRMNPGKKNAEKTSQVLHLLFWVIVAPFMAWGVFYPGLSRYDRLLSLSSLPSNPILTAVGFLSMLIGMVLILIANVSLWFYGKGANAFFLTRQLVVASVYEWTRNPMSLGVYLGSVGAGLLMRSTYMTFGTLLILMPVHIFYLRYFEEYELEMRLGQSYIEYKQRVPFLLPGRNYLETNWRKHE